ncbi:MAG: hypothetical protein AB7O04_05630 [Hyphomonadaceae bacterium]
MSQLEALDDNAKTLIVAAALLEYLERELLAMSVVPSEIVRALRTANDLAQIALVHAGVTEEMRRSAFSGRRRKKRT